MKNNSQKIIKKILPIKLIALCALIFSSIIFGMNTGSNFGQPYPQPQFNAGSNAGPSSGQQFPFGPLQTSLNPPPVQQQSLVDNLVNNNNALQSAIAMVNQLDQRVNSSQQALTRAGEGFSSLSNNQGEINEKLNEQKAEIKNLRDNQGGINDKLDEKESNINTLNDSQSEINEKLNRQKAEMENLSNNQGEINERLAQYIANDRNCSAKWSAFYKTSFIASLSAMAAYFIVGELNKRAKVKRNESKKYNAKKVTGIVAATTFLLVSAYHYLSWQSVTPAEIIN